MCVYKPLLAARIYINVGVSVLSNSLAWSHQFIYTSAPFSAVFIPKMTD